VRTYGLTGNIGAGKSTVARLLVDAGVPVIDADLLAREVVMPGTDGLAEIARRFPGSVGADGALDRKALAARVFADADERAALNAIVHPRIAQAAAARTSALAKAGAPLAVYEAALIVENGLHRAMDGLIVVTAPPEVQLARIMRRDGATEAEARARIAAQLPQAEKAALADFVIENTGSLESLAARVAEVITALRDAAAQGKQAP
jgi:dephospho-CoA kinase